jgi:hypothetical protein
MAGETKPDDSQKQLKQDRLVEQLMPDPANPQPTIQIRGWLGKGTKEGLWRVYINSSLDEFFEFSDKDIVHTEPIPEQQSHLGATTVWLNRGAVLQHTQIVSRQVQAGFLSGGITSGFLAGTAFSFPSGLKGFAVITGVCTHTRICRNTVGEGCPTGVLCGGGTGDFCQSGAFVCNPTDGCTQFQPCSQNCPTIGCTAGCTVDCSNFCGVTRVGCA